MTCARPECDNDVVRPHTGRPPKYCTAYCRKRHHYERTHPTTEET